MRRLVEQGVDPMKAGIDWEDFRTKQREAALDTVKATLMLDDVAKREAIEVPRRRRRGGAEAVRRIVGAHRAPPCGTASSTRADSAGWWSGCAANAPWSS